MNARKSISTHQAAKLLDITPQGMRKKLRNGELTYEWKKGNGGKVRFVFVDSLPPDARKRLIQDTIPSHSDGSSADLPTLPLEYLPPAEFKKCLEAHIPSPHDVSPANPPSLPIYDPHNPETSLTLYTQAPAWKRDKATFRYNIVKACEGLTGSALAAAITILRQKYPDFTEDLRTVERWIERYETYDISGLMPDWGKNKRKWKVEDKHFEYYKSLFLKEGSPSEHSCHLKTLGFAISADPAVTKENFPSAAAFRRRLNAEIPKEFQFYARHGESAWNKKYASYVDRDYSNIHAYQCVVSDFHLLDVFVINPKTGRAERPWICVMMDMRTSKWLSWIVTFEDPCSDHVFAAMFIMFSKYGLPDEFYFDNGTVYKCRGLAHQHSRNVKVTINESTSRTQLCALSQLMIKVHFALPYRAQSKSLERWFRTLINLWVKSLPGYCGSNPNTRPEGLAEEIKKGTLLSFDTFKKMFDEFVERGLNCHKSRGKVLKGRSPNEAWLEEFTKMRSISKEAIAIFCRKPIGDLTIGRNGVLVSETGLKYWNDKMHYLRGEKVYLRISPDNVGEAFVFSARTDKFICAAAADVRVVPGLCKTDADNVKLREVLRAQRREKRIVRAYANLQTLPSAEEQHLNLLSGIAALGGVAPEADPKIIMLRNTAMDIAIKENERQEKAKPMDLTGFAPPAPPPEKIPSFYWASERNSWLESSADNRSAWIDKHGELPDDYPGPRESISAAG